MKKILLLHLVTLFKFIRYFFYFINKIAVVKTIEIFYIDLFFFNIIEKSEFFIYLIDIGLKSSNYKKNLRYNFLIY